MGQKREKRKERRGTKREKIDREVNQHDERGAIQVRGEVDILQLCSRSPKLITHWARGNYFSYITINTC